MRRYKMKQRAVNTCISKISASKTSAFSESASKLSGFKLKSEVLVKGFSLVEVLIALVIFVIAAVTLSSFIEGRVTQYNKNVDLTLKAWVASNQMTEALVYGVQEKSETIEYANAEWETTWSIEPTENENLNRLTIEVKKVDEPSARLPFKLVSMVPNNEN